MTTFALIAGMVPVAIGAGEGADFRAPLGRAVIGGVITSTHADAARDSDVLRSADGGCATGWARRLLRRKPVAHEKKQESPGRRGRQNSHASRQDDDAHAGGRIAFRMARVHRLVNRVV